MGNKYDDIHGYNDLNDEQKEEFENTFGKVCHVARYVEYMTGWNLGFEKYYNHEDDDDDDDDY